MNFANAYDPFRALQGAWGLLKKAPATVLVGGVLMALTDGGCSGGNQSTRGGGESFGGVDAVVFVVIAIGVLVVSVGFWLFACLLKVGFPSAVENVHKTGAEDVGTIFQSEGRWLNMVAATFLQALAGLAAVAPMLLIVGLALLVSTMGEGAALGIVVIGALLWLPFFIYIVLGLSLIPMAVAIERLSPIEAFRRSWELVRGNRLQLFLFYLVTAVFSVLGLLACCVGVFFTSALAYTASADAFLRLVRADEEQSGWVTWRGASSRR